MGSLYAPSGFHGEHNPAVSVLCLRAQPLVSLDELVKDGVNGLVFHNAEQLAAQLEVRLSPSTLEEYPKVSIPGVTESPSRVSFSTGTRHAPRVVRAQGVRRITHKEPRYWWTGVGVGHLVGKLGPRHATAVAA